ncbi:molybdate ABC transporter substrate-binding protein [Sulfitobacter sp. S190]|uniref:molybdate ABC transporter substrate-binding protein n=1 Tax=Sulfitobacter sp. S190 TaxID=2867022 RepID=UPI0021A8E64E|nr:molybdate ABC transporter substrate-binding protein [Sulfitobacter sp. S190]UWR23433.1 molybdate ABC transporter substrate-binding protein [Sulfitobacter sp. S190]
MMRMLLALLLLLPLPLAAQDRAVTVFAAASLRDALGAIAQDFGTPVRFSFGGSGSMARQVAAGAPADVVVLAHKDWMAWLVAGGHVDTDAVRSVASGQLVLIGQTGGAALTTPDSATLKAALDGGRLAIGQRDSVPAGSYARDWLRHIGAWDALKPHLAETDNVRAALALVAQGAAPLGVVYAADAAADPRVSVRYAIPPDSHAPITYPAAALTPAGAAFVAHLGSPAAQARLRQYGFGPESG